MARPIGSIAQKLEQARDPGEIRRLRAGFVDRDRTMGELVKTYKMSQKTIEAICADLPPRTPLPRLKRQAPSGLRGFL